MTREIKDHVVHGQPCHVRIEAVDEPGVGGANAAFEFLILKDKLWQKHGRLQFQKGPVRILDEKGNFLREDVNGITNEVLLAVVIDRLQSFQKSPYSCRENALAITKLEEALHWLNHRTNERLQREVAGTHAV